MELLHRSRELPCSRGIPPLASAESGGRQERFEVGQPVICHDLILDRHAHHPAEQHRAGSEIDDVVTYAFKRDWCFGHARCGHHVGCRSGEAHTSANSFDSALNGAEVAFMTSIRDSVPILTTNSPVASTLRQVSLWPIEVTDRIAGSVQAMVKKEYGARFGVPSDDAVETHAIGRGVIDAVNRAYMLLAGAFSGEWTMRMGTFCR